MVIGYAAYNATFNIYGKSSVAENISDFNVYLSSLKVNGTEVSGINNAKDGFTIETPINGTLEYEITNDSTEYDTETSLECESNKAWNYDYTGGEQTFTAPATGTYNLEVWGAQGESYASNFYGGYGGYSSGNISLQQNEKLYVNVGGKGNSLDGGYNGGGSVSNGNYGRAGGGATHIALTTGLLSTLENSVSKIIVVAGGGGGAANRGEGYGDGNGGSAGGYIGNSGESVNHNNGFGYGYGTGGSQTSGGKLVWIQGTSGTDRIMLGTFGTGFGSTIEGYTAAGGGSGFYGGGGAFHGGAGGGSGYIGNNLLTNKVMYCYNCTESNEESLKTISTSCVSTSPSSSCAKSGNGYARIKLLNQPEKFSTEKTTITAQDKKSMSINNINQTIVISCKLKTDKLSRTSKIYNGPTKWTFDYTGGEQVFITPIKGIYKLEVWGAQGGNKNNYLGGYGGYSIGTITINQFDKLYINVGGIGTANTAKGGYNGGGNIQADQYGFGSPGGGATHIALRSGLLSTLENCKSDILIVAGGGGGANNRSAGYGDGNGGSAGGYIGNSGKSINHTKNFGYGYGTGGTQASGGSANWIKESTEIDSSSLINGIFGSAGIVVDKGSQSGGGGGFYGGGGGSHGGAGGGSGYIGNNSLTSKVMYCYNCTESNETSTKTITTTCTNETAMSACAKSGNGYAQITLIQQL